MSGHMFFGGDYLGFDDALFAAARLLEIVSRRPFGLAAAARRPAAHHRHARDPGGCARGARSSAWSSGPRRTSPSRYPVNTIDGVRITFPNGWGLLRASNTQPILVLRFEAIGSAVAGRRPQRGRRLARGAGRPGLTPCPAAAAGSPSLVAGLVVLLFAGRWTAGLLADRWWAARALARRRSTSSPTGTSSGLILELAGVVVAARLVHRPPARGLPRRRLGPGPPQRGQPRVPRGAHPGALLARRGRRRGAARPAWWARAPARTPREVALGWQGVTYGVARAAAAARHRALRRAGAALARAAATSRSCSSCSALAPGLRPVHRWSAPSAGSTAAPPSTTTRAPTSAGCWSRLALTLMWGYLLEPFELVAGYRRACPTAAVWRATTLRRAAPGRRGARDRAARRRSGRCAARHALAAAGLDRAARSPRWSATGWCRPRSAARASRSSSGGRVEQFERLAYGLEALSESGRPAPRRADAARGAVALEPGRWPRACSPPTRWTSSSVDPALLTVGGQAAAGVARRPRALPGGRVVVSRPGGRPHRAGRARRCSTARRIRCPSRSSRRCSTSGTDGVSRPGARLPARTATTMPGVALDSWPRRVLLAWALQAPELLGPLAAGARVDWALTPARRLRAARAVRRVGRAGGAGRRRRAALAGGRLRAGRRPFRSRTRIDWRGRRVAGLRGGAARHRVGADRRGARIYLRPGSDALASLVGRDRRGRGRAGRRDARGGVARGAVSGRALPGAGAAARALGPAARDARAAAPAPTLAELPRIDAAWADDTTGPVPRGRRSSVPGERRLSALLVGEPRGGDRRRCGWRGSTRPSALPSRERAREPLGPLPLLRRAERLDPDDGRPARARTGAVRPRRRRRRRLPVALRAAPADGRPALVWVTVAAGDRLGAGHTLKEAWSNLLGASVPAHRRARPRPPGWTRRGAGSLRADSALRAADWDGLRPRLDRPAARARRCRSDSAAR